MVRRSNPSNCVSNPGPEATVEVCDCVKHFKWVLNIIKQSFAGVQTWFKLEVGYDLRPSLVNFLYSPSLIVWCGYNSVRRSRC